MNTICLNRAAEQLTDVHETFCRSTWRGREEKGEGREKLNNGYLLHLN